MAARPAAWAWVSAWALSLLPPGSSAPPTLDCQARRGLLPRPHLGAKPGISSLRVPTSLQQSWAARKGRRLKGLSVHKAFSRPTPHDPRK